MLGDLAVMSVVLIASAAFLIGALSFAPIFRWSERRITAKDIPEVYALQEELFKLDDRYDDLMMRLSYTQEERDSYKEIAMSHEVTWTGWPTTEVYAWVPDAKWQPRQFDAAPEVNFRRMKVALDAVDCERVRVHFELHVAGAVKTHLYEQRWGGIDRVSREHSKFLEATFEGPPAEVHDEIRQFVRQSRWSLGAWESGTEWKWATGGYPMRFVLKLDTLERQEVPVKPNVRYVEVAVPEKIIEIREVEVEKPVLLPKEGLTEERLRAIAEVEAELALARREAKR